jgi:hypothetical protein
MTSSPTGSDLALNKMLRLKKSAFSIFWGSTLLSQVSKTLAFLTPDDMKAVEEVSTKVQGACATVGCDSPDFDAERARRHLKEASPNSITRHLQVDECVFETLLCNLDFLEVCLEQEYNDDPLGYCEEKETIKFTNKEDPDDAKFRYHNQGPEQLQGVFWLNYQPNTWSSLVTFAKTREAFGGIATGELGNIIGESPLGFSGKITNPFDYAYQIRVLGDRNWAFGKTPADLIEKRPPCRTRLSNLNLTLHLLFDP